jgi:hypothetical protein
MVKMQPLPGREVLALGGELDHFALGALAHGDAARGGGAAPFELHGLGDCRSDLVAEVSVEEPASRLGQPELPAGRVGTNAVGDLGDALARSAELGIELGPLRVRHLARGVVRLHRVVDERVEGVLLAQVLEEVLLPPPLEHPVGDFDGEEVAAERDDGCLVAIGEPSDLAQAQLAAEESDALVGEPVGDAPAVKDGGVRLEASAREMAEVPLAVGEDVEAGGDERREQRGAPPAAVEDHGDAAFAHQPAHLVDELGQHGHQAGVGLGGDHEERLASGIVHPVVGGRRQRETHAGDVRLRDVTLAVVDAHVAIDVEEAERGATRRDAPLAEEAAEACRAADAGQARELAAQRLDLRGAVESKEAAEVLGRVLLEALGTLDAQERHE